MKQYVKKPAGEQKIGGRQAIIADFKKTQEKEEEAWKTKDEKSLKPPEQDLRSISAPPVKLVRKSHLGLTDSFVFLHAQSDQLWVDNEVQKSLDYAIFYYKTRKEKHFDPRLPKPVIQEHGKPLCALL